MAIFNSYMLVYQRVAQARQDHWKDMEDSKNPTLDSSVWRVGICNPIPQP